MEDDLNLWKMESNPNFKENGGRLSCWQNGRRHQFFGKIEDNLNFSAKWKTTSILRKMDEDINLYLTEKKLFLTMSKENTTLISVMLA